MISCAIPVRLAEILVPTIATSSKTQVPIFAPMIREIPDVRSTTPSMLMAMIRLVVAELLLVIVVKIVPMRIP